MDLTLLRRARQSRPHFQNNVLSFVEHSALYQNAHLSFPPLSRCWHYCRSDYDRQQVPLNFTSKECSTTFPASATSEIVSYGSALQKWYSSHSAEIKRGQASCSEIGVFTEVGGCGKALVAANTGKATGGASSATTTSAASVSATGSETKGTASSSSSEGIGARETGIAAAVVAAAGLVAAVL
ncbi:hypothetical protein V2G26_004555 [Clonostachys chloroleuca]